jgi:hypothetical protein
MKRRQQSPDRRVLQKCWGQWTEIIELFALRRRARKRLDPRAYVELHRELTERCRVLARSSNDVEAAFYRYLEDLVQPWLDLAILTRCERDILFDLLIRCRQIETQLGGRSWFRSVPAWCPPALVAMFFFAIMLLWMGRFSILLTTILNHARDWSDDLYLRAIHSSDAERLFLIGCILVAISIYAVSRTAKS